MRAAILLLIALTGCDGRLSSASGAVLTDSATGCQYMAEFSSDGTWGKITVTTASYEKCRRKQ